MSLAFLAWGVGIVLAWLVYRTAAPRPLKGVPGPRWFPYFGSLLEMRQNLPRLFDWVLEQHEINNFNSFVVCLPGVKPILTVMMSTKNPANVQHIMRDNFSNYTLSPLRTVVMGDFIGHGIFTTNGHEWAVTRKTLNPAFSTAQLKNYVSEVFVSHGRQFVSRLDSAAREGRAVDLHDMFYRFTLDCFGLIGFGEEFGCLKMEDPHPFAVAFDKCQSLLIHRRFDPLWKIKRFLRIGFEREIKRHLDVINSYAYSIIRKRREQPSHNASSKDLISLYTTGDVASEYKISDKMLRDLVVNFMVAGRDTTAAALSWFFYEMALHPEEEKKVVQEIDAVTSNGTCDFTYETASRLTYTECAFLETLRLHPSVAMDDKYALKDDVLPDGTFIPAGSIVSFAPWAWGRSPENWGPDVLEFKPSRWMASPRPSAYQFPTFNAGPRICMGKGMAIAEAKTIISMILSRYRLDLEPPKSAQYRVSVTLAMKEPLMMRVESR